MGNSTDLFAKSHGHPLWSIQSFVVDRFSTLIPDFIYIYTYMHVCTHTHTDTHIYTYFKVEFFFFSLRQQKCEMYSLSSGGQKPPIFFSS